MRGAEGRRNLRVEEVARQRCARAFARLRHTVGALGTLGGPDYHVRERLASNMVAAEGAPASTWLYSLLSNATWGLARLLHWADGSAVAARRRCGVGSRAAALARHALRAPPPSADAKLALSLLLPPHPPTPRPLSAYLLGAYAPVEREVEAARLEVVEGELPPELAGFYARVGPNPHPDRPPMGGYHW